jgi:hypothetical protein
MKLWQLKNVLSDELEIFDFHFSSFNDYQQDMPEYLILQALEKSRKTMLVTDKGYLRFTLLNDNSLVVEKLPIVDAYRKYGGDRINDVIDYGSINIGIGR